MREGTTVSIESAASGICVTYFCSTCSLSGLCDHSCGYCASTPSTPTIAPSTSATAAACLDDDDTVTSFSGYDCPTLAAVHTTTLSGGYATRLFFLQNNSTLSLRGVNLVRGVSHSERGGGAVFVSAGGHLLLYSVRISDNRAQIGGAISTIRSTVVATDCTMASNSATRGGAFAVGDNSTVTTTRCTMASNSANFEGGALTASDDSTVTVTDCTMSSNSAYFG